MTTQTSITGYSLTHKGMTINYLKGRTPAALSFDTLAACQILQAYGMFPDYEQDENGELFIITQGTYQGQPHTSRFPFHRLAGRSGTIFRASAMPKDLVNFFEQIVRIGFEKMITQRKAA